MNPSICRPVVQPSSNAGSNPPSDPLPAGNASLWFVAYDIRQPKRLRQVHRCVRRVGIALQYSGFAVHGTDDSLSELLRRLEGIIDKSVDDVRAYHLPKRCQVWSLGRQSWPDELTLTGSEALATLLNTADCRADSEAGTRATIEVDSRVAGMAMPGAPQR
jgi:CRISPR-associated protein Cas2